MCVLLCGRYDEHISERGVAHHTANRVAFDNRSAETATRYDNGRTTPNLLPAERVTRRAPGNLLRVPTFVRVAADL